MWAIRLGTFGFSKFAVDMSTANAVFASLPVQNSHHSKPQHKVFNSNY